MPTPGANTGDLRPCGSSTYINSTVLPFCAAWSDNIGAAELAAFFTDDAVYHNIPLAPVTGREAIASTIASFIRRSWEPSRSEAARSAPDATIST